jgi:hypothetical protein
MRSLFKLVLAFAFLSPLAAQQIFRLKTCGKESDSPRQYNWFTKNKTFSNIVASNLEDGNLHAPVGDAINCPGNGNDCHSWGASFDDRNGVVFLNGSWSVGFTIETWPLPDSRDGPHCPGLNGGTCNTPGNCATASSGAHPKDGDSLQMQATGPNCLRFIAQGMVGNATRLGVLGAGPIPTLCLDADVPPKPTPAQPTPPPTPAPAPAFAGVTCKDPRFSSAPYCNRSLPVAARVASIVSQMTIFEKIAMTSNGNQGIGRLGIRPFQFGEGLHGVDSTCGQVVGEADEWGARTGCATSYPSGIAEVLPKTTTPLPYSPSPPPLALFPSLARSSHTPSILILHSYSRAPHSISRSGSLWARRTGGKVAVCTTRKTLPHPHHRGH